MSVSSSRMLAIFTIAAPADCSWPYTSDSSCSGWKTSWRSAIAVISVPIVSVPWSYRCEPKKRTLAIASTPRNSIPGKKTEKIRWTYVA